MIIAVIWFAVFLPLYLHGADDNQAIKQESPRLVSVLNGTYDDFVLVPHKHFREDDFGIVNHNTEELEGCTFKNMFYVAPHMKKVVDVGQYRQLIALHASDAFRRMTFRTSEYVCSYINSKGMCDDKTAPCKKCYPENTVVKKWTINPKKAFIFTVDRGSDAVTIIPSYSKDEFIIESSDKHILTPITNESCSNIGITREYDEIDCMLARLMLSRTVPPTQTKIIDIQRGITSLIAHDLTKRAEGFYGYCGLSLKPFVLREPVAQTVSHNFKMVKSAEVDRTIDLCNGTESALWIGLAAQFAYGKIVYNTNILYEIPDDECVQPQEKKRLYIGTSNVVCVGHPILDVDGETIMPERHTQRVPILEHSDSFVVIKNSIGLFEAKDNNQVEIKG